MVAIEDIRVQKFHLLFNSSALAVTPASPAYIDILVAGWCSLWLAQQKPQHRWVQQRLTGTFQRGNEAFTCTYRQASKQEFTHWLEESWHKLEEVEERPGNLRRSPLYSSPSKDMQFLEYKISCTQSLLTRGVLDYHPIISTQHNQCLCRPGMIVWLCFWKAPCLQN